MVVGCVDATNSPIGPDFLCDTHDVVDDIEVLGIVTAQRLRASSCWMAQRLCVAFANFGDRIALRQIERQFIDRGRAL